MRSVQSQISSLERRVNLIPSTDDIPEMKVEFVDPNNLDEVEFARTHRLHRGSSLWEEI